MNKVVLVGTVGKVWSTDKAFKFSVNTTESWKDKDGAPKERTDFTNAVMFGPQALSMGQNATVGTRIALSGRIGSSSYEKDGQKIYKTEVIVSDMEVIGSNSVTTDETIPF